jgi:hypothetical protein
MYGPARQRRFLQALVGPAGQPVTFRRRGSLAPDAEMIILDLYDVTIAGADNPIELYLDLYRWDPPKAPKGFVCGTDIGLAPPEPRETTMTTTTTATVPVPRPPDMVRPKPEDVYERLLEFVLAAPAVAAPIPLQPGSTARGMIFDHPRLMSIAAREIASRGATPSKQNMPVVEPSFFIVANPISCDGTDTTPASITVEAGPVGRIGGSGGVLTGDALRKALPGVELREGAAGARFGGYIPRGGVVTVATSQPGCAAARFTLAGGVVMRKLVDAPGIPPPGLSATPSGYIGNMTLKVSFAIGPDGAPFAATVVNGDARYAEAALEAVRKWRFEMPTINGAPTYSPSTLTTDVVFR